MCLLLLHDCSSAVLKTRTPSVTASTVVPGGVSAVDRDIVTMQLFFRCSPEDKDPFNDYYRSAVFLHGEGKAVQMERPEDRPFATLMAGLPMPGADASDSSPSDHSDTGQEAKEDGEEGQKEEEEEEEGSSSDASDRTEEGARSQSPTTSDFVMLPPLVSRFCDLPCKLVV